MSRARSNLVTFPTDYKPEPPEISECHPATNPPREFIEGRMNLNGYVVRNPLQTFFVRLTTSSERRGILAEDILVIDRSLECQHGDLVVARIGAELKMRRIVIRGRSTWIEDEDGTRIKIKTGDEDVEVWGKATFLIRAIGKGDAEKGEAA